MPAHEETGSASAFWIPALLYNPPPDLDKQYLYDMVIRTARIYFDIVGPEAYQAFWQHKGVAACLRRKDLTELEIWLNEARWRAEYRDQDGFCLLGCIDE